MHNPFSRRPPARPPSIDTGLAHAIAGQLAVGLARNAEPEPGGGVTTWHAELEQSAERARLALFAIGLMIRNADPSTQPILDQAVTIAYDRSTGITQLRVVAEADPHA